MYWWLVASCVLNALLSVFIIVSCKRNKCDKLKEVSEVARNQVEMFESKAEIENIEMEALRHQVIDLQTQTDEKVIEFRGYYWFLK